MPLPSPRLVFLLAALAATLCCHPLHAQTTLVPPPFEAYPASRSVTALAPLRFTRVPAARVHRTAIRTSYTEKGINFAGHYHLAEWGCGTFCRGIALADTLSGEVLVYAPILPEDPYLPDAPLGLEYKGASRLLVFNPLTEREKGTPPETWQEARTRDVLGAASLPQAMMWNETQKRLEPVPIASLKTPNHPICIDGRSS